MIVFRKCRRPKSWHGGRGESDFVEVGFTTDQRRLLEDHGTQMNPPESPEKIEKAGNIWEVARHIPWTSLGHNMHSGALLVHWGYLWL